MNRQVRIARTMLLDAMLLGVVLAKDGDRDEILAEIKPNDMTSVTGRQLLESIKDGSKSRFVKLMARRLGVQMSTEERAIPAVLRTVKLRNASEAARSMTKIMLESINDSHDLEDTAEAWAEALEQLQRVVVMEKKLETRKK
ncbi:MAG: hypothetical protein AAFV88_11620 [Planctomycetota bacterium]